jgi:hypothetical protein
MLTTFVAADATAAAAVHAVRGALESHCCGPCTAATTAPVTLQ